MANLKIAALHKSFGPVKVLEGVDLDIPSGEFLVLLGPSGCGKTTTLKMIAGLHPVTSGEVLFDSELVNFIPPEKREAVMVYQNYLLFPYMNIEENIGFGLKMRHVKKEIISEKVKEMLKLMQLEGFENRKPSQLSGGQKQRVALARALIIQPKVLLLDEPLSNLDAHLRDEMRELILNIQRRLNVTTVFVTHDQEEAVLLADRIALMFDGVLQQYSEPKEFYEKPATKRIAAFFGNRNVIAGIKSGNTLKTNTGVFRIRGFKRPNGKILAAVRPENVHIGHSKENSFKALVKRQIYMGTYTRYKIEVDGLEWDVIGPPDFNSNLENKFVDFTLPQDKIWLLDDVKMSGTEESSRKVFDPEVPDTKVPGRTNSDNT